LKLHHSKLHRALTGPRETVSVVAGTCAVADLLRQSVKGARVYRLLY
jgi:hypothetical protein